MYSNYSNYFNLSFIYYYGKSLLRNCSNNILTCLCFNKKRKLFRYKKKYDFFYKNPVYKQPLINQTENDKKDKLEREIVELQEIIIVPNHLIKEKKNLKSKTIEKKNNKKNSKRFKSKIKKNSFNHLKKINYKINMNGEVPINSEVLINNGQVPINKSVKKIIDNENRKFKELVLDQSYSKVLNRSKNLKLKKIEEKDEPKKNLIIFENKDHLDEWEMLS